MPRRISGGFQLASSTTVYILVRGNSLSTLGVTSNYLDAPRVRLFNQAGQDLIFDNGGSDLVVPRRRFRGAPGG